MTNSNHKTVVIFGANGGIGKRAAAAIAEQLGENGHVNAPIDVCLVARPKDIAKNPAKGVKAEIRQALANDSHVRLDNVFKDKNLIAWDPENPTAEANQRLSEALKQADVIVVAAGEARKPIPGKPTPPRSTLIEPNSKIVLPMSRAIANYAPVNTPVVTCTNPLDNIVTIINEQIAKTWHEMGKTEKPKNVKVLGMAGTLDEVRFRINMADAINDALSDQNVSLLPKDIEGRIYGQHGPAMVFDTSRTKINYHGHAYGFQEFLNHYGFNDTAKQNKMLDGIKAKTIKDGQEIVDNMGGSAQEGPGKRLGELVMGLLYGKGHTVTASIVHPWPGDVPGARVVASGCRVDISDQGIVPVQEEISDEVKAAITSSRREIVADAAKHDLINHIKSGKDLCVSTEGEINMSLPNMSKEALDMVASLVDEAYKLDKGTTKVLRGMTPKIVFTPPPKAVEDFAKIALAAGVIAPDTAIPVEQRVRTA